MVAITRRMSVSKVAYKNSVSTIKESGQFGGACWFSIEYLRMTFLVQVRRDNLDEIVRFEKST